MSYKITLRDEIPGPISRARIEHPVEINKGFTRVKIFYSIDARIPAPIDNVCQIVIQELSILPQPCIIASAEGIELDFVLEAIVIGSDRIGKEYILGTNYNNRIQSISYTIESIDLNDEFENLSTELTFEFS